MKTVLKLENDYSFYLLAIVSSKKDFQFCWLLNNSLSIKLAKDADLEFVDNKLGQNLKFSRYCYLDNVNNTEWYVIANQFEANLLIPELKEVDYFIMIRENHRFLNKKEIKENLKKDLAIEAVFELDPNELNSKQNLIF